MLTESSARGVILGILEGWEEVSRTQVLFPSCSKGRLKEVCWLCRAGHKKRLFAWQKIQKEVRVGQSGVANPES